LSLCKTALRSSTKLKGIKIENHAKLITKLFADDTLVYLGKNDRFSDLEGIINLFCNVSTACFNMEKTEALPIGTPEHRNKVITRRILSENTNKLPESLQLIKDSEPMRTLVSWIGNNIEIEDKWNKSTEIQKKGNQCMESITPYPPRKRAHIKSTDNIKKLVSSSSKWYARPHRKRNDQDNEIFYLGWKQERTNEAGLHSRNKRKGWPWNA